MKLNIIHVKKLFIIIVAERFPASELYAENKWLTISCLSFFFNPQSLSISEIGFERKNLSLS